MRHRNFDPCTTEEHKALKTLGEGRCPRCGERTRTVIPEEEFAERLRKKKYGCNRKRLAGLGYPDDFGIGYDEPTDETED